MGLLCVLLSSLLVFTAGCKKEVLSSTVETIVTKAENAPTNPLSSQSKSHTSQGAHQDFGEASPNSAVKKEITVVNPFLTAVQLKQSQLEDENFKITSSDCPKILGPEAQCKIEIQFLPKKLGVYDSKLAIKYQVNEAISAPQELVFSLKGRGVQFSSGKETQNSAVSSVNISSGNSISGVNINSNVSSGISLNSTQSFATASSLVIQQADIEDSQKPGNLWPERAQPEHSLDGNTRMYDAQAISGDVNSTQYVESDTISGLKPFLGSVSPLLVLGVVSHLPKKVESKNLTVSPNLAFTGEIKKEDSFLQKNTAEKDFIKAKKHPLRLEKNTEKKDLDKQKTRDPSEPPPKDLQDTNPTESPEDLQDTNPTESNDEEVEVAELEKDFDFDSRLIQDQSLDAFLYYPKKNRPHEEWIEGSFCLRFYKKLFPELTQKYFNKKFKKQKINLNNIHMAMNEKKGKLKLISRKYFDKNFWVLRGPICKNLSKECKSFMKKTYKDAKAKHKLRIKLEEFLSSHYPQCIQKHVKELFF